MSHAADWAPPWQSLPADLADVLAPVVPTVVERMIQEVPDQIPAYAEARHRGYGGRIEMGVTIAFRQLLRLPGTSQPALNAESRAVLAALGAGEFREGRSMDALLGAYRTAARIAFRELSGECARQGLDLSVVVDLGESIWAYIDELSSVSAQAYAAEQSARAGVLELRRSQLASALVRGDAGPGEVRRLATTADWPLPSRLAVVVLPGAGAATARAALGRGGLVLEGEEETLVVVQPPRAPRARRRLLGMLAGTGAVVGPTVTWEEVPYSCRVARTLAAQRGPSGGAEPLLAEEHLGRVVLGAEPRVVDELAARVLAPLEALTPAKREVLEETLVSWLAHWGQRARIAAELNVHPQTVGYRVQRLRELFGDALEDPDARFDLELVLRTRRGPR